MCTEWFVEPWSSADNGLVAQLTSAECAESVRCADQKQPRDLWRVDHHAITRLERERKVGKVRFTVWKRDRPSQLARKWHFEGNGARKRPKPKKKHPARSS